MNKIKNLRLERGWTQEELGKILNVQKAAISKYENGIASPSIEILKTLSSVFGVSIDYLLDNETKIKTDNHHLTKEQTTLLRDFDSLSSDGRNILLGVLKSLANTSPASASMA